MICRSKQLNRKVRLRRFIYYCCHFYIRIPWGNKFDLSESCPESWAGRIFAQTNIRLNGVRSQGSAVGPNVRAVKPQHPISFRFAALRLLFVIAKEHTLLRMFLNIWR